MPYTVDEDDTVVFLEEPNPGPTWSSLSPAMPDAGRPDGRGDHQVRARRDHQTAERPDVGAARANDVRERLPRVPARPLRDSPPRRPRRRAPGRCRPRAVRAEPGRRALVLRVRDGERPTLLAESTSHQRVLLAQQPREHMGWRRRARETRARHGSLGLEPHNPARRTSRRGTDAQPSRAPEAHPEANRARPTSHPVRPVERDPRAARDSRDRRQQLRRPRRRSTGQRWRSRNRQPSQAR